MVSIPDSTVVGYLVVEGDQLKVISLDLPIPPNSIPLTYGQACQVNDLRKVVEKKVTDKYWE